MLFRIESARPRFFWRQLAESVPRTQGAWGNIRPMSVRVNIPSFCNYLYGFRNLVERFFQQAQTFSNRGGRKTRRRCLAVVKLAASRIWFLFISR
jgi:hypothetical protein